MSYVAEKKCQKTFCEYKPALLRITLKYQSKNSPIVCGVDIK